MLDHPRQVDVGERIAVDDQESAGLAEAAQLRRRIQAPPKRF